MYAFMWQCNTCQNITCDINWTGAGNLIIWTNDFPFKVNVLGISYFQSSVQIQSSPTNQIFYIIHGFISTYTNMCSKILCCIWRIVKINIDILYMYQSYNEWQHVRCQRQKTTEASLSMCLPTAYRPHEIMYILLSLSLLCVTTANSGCFISISI